MSLTHFRRMFHSCPPWGRQGAKGFLTFSVGIGMGIGLRRVDNLVIIFLWAVRPSLGHLVGGWVGLMSPGCYCLGGCGHGGGVFGAGCGPMGFWDVHGISWFLNVLNCQSFGNWLVTSYIPCLLLIIAIRFTCG